MRGYLPLFPLLFSLFIHEFIQVILEYLLSVLLFRVLESRIILKSPGYLVELAETVKVLLFF